jgi:lipopolysaccharide transport system ATP-binding protein
MSDIVIKSEHLSKSYMVGHQRPEHGGYVALRDVIASGVRSFARKGADFFAGRQIVQGDEIEEFWALKDVSFEVREGEVFGIIGANGAGKSTLLKVLSRITEPTEGEVRIKGRVASLLEVGTGFHPELTGRENIYLNGAILGMSRAEIRRKFDEIVAFAEVEQFLDTPVKRYSSGMYVRLAFAVAANLDSEIVIIDEVLAVGDQAFQSKCFDKMNAVSSAGRTVLLVSHNLAAVRTLCSRAMLIDRGRIRKDGQVNGVIETYLDRGLSRGQWYWPERERPRSSVLELLAVELEGERSGAAGCFQQDEEVQLKLIYSQLDDCADYRFVIQLLTASGEVAFTSTDQRYRGAKSYGRGRYRTVCTIPARLLNRGNYAIRVWAGMHFVGQYIKPVDVGRFTIEGTNVSGSIFDSDWPGVVCPDLRWEVVEETSSTQLQSENSWCA